MHDLILWQAPKAAVLVLIVERTTTAQNQGTIAWNVYLARRLLQAEDLSYWTTADMPHVHGSSNTDSCLGHLPLQGALCVRT